MNDDQYLDRQVCWSEHESKIEGFLIIRRNSYGEYFPRFLSAHCYTEGDMSLVLGLEFPVTGDGGELMRRGIIDRPLSGNIITEQMPGSSFVKIVAFRSRLRTVPQQGGLPNAFQIADVDFAVDAGMSEKELVDLGPTGRWRRFQEIQD